jgi:hypothetical protein
MNATQPVWFCKFGAVFAATLMICWATPRVFDDIPDFPLINADRLHVRILNHYFQSPTPAIALAGSSLTERLKENYFERRDIRNIGLGGGSPLTGLTVLAETTWKRPAIVAIETNIMLRGVDQELVREFHKVDHPIIAFAPLRAPLAFYQKRLDAPPPAYEPKRCDTVFDIPAAPRLVNSDDTAKVGAEFEDPGLDDRIRNDVATLKALVERLEAERIKVYLYELPTLSAIEQTRYVRTMRSALASSFDSRRWLQLKYPAAEIRWDDAIHFDDRSAIILACALERALNSESGNQDHSGASTDRNG